MATIPLSQPVLASLVSIRFFNGRILTGDAFVARLEPDGSHGLSRSFGGPITQNGDHVAIDDQGSIWLTGSFNQPFQAGDELLTPEGYDIYLIRLCP